LFHRGLNQENILFYINSFEHLSDVCSSAKDHAKELAQIVQNIKNETGHNQVNTAGYSKGGLDARAYLAHDSLTTNINRYFFKT
jgi:poly(3-hydroxyalkanoate) synthetase